MTTTYDVEQWQLTIDHTPGNGPSAWEGHFEDELEVNYTAATLIELLEKMAHRITVDGMP